MPGRKWTAEQKSFYRSWRSYYPSLVYARNDPHTLGVAIDHAVQDGRHQSDQLLQQLPGKRSTALCGQDVAVREGPAAAQVLRPAQRFDGVFDQGPLSASQAPVCSPQPQERVANLERELEEQRRARRPP